MTTIEDLIALVESVPTCETYIAMLTDELMGARDMTRPEAENHARKVAQTVIDREEVAEAITLFTKNSESRDIIIEELDRLRPVNSLYTLSLGIMPGDSPPVWQSQDCHTGGEHYSYLIPSAGARWVIGVVAAARYRKRPPRSRRQLPPRGRHP